MDKYLHTTIDVEMQDIVFQIVITVMSYVKVYVRSSATKHFIEKCAGVHFTFYWHGLSNYTHYIMRAGWNYLSIPKLQRVHPWSLEWINDFILHFIMGVIDFSCHIRVTPC